MRSGQVEWLAVSPRTPIVWPVPLPCKGIAPYNGASSGELGERILSPITKAETILREADPKTEATPSPCVGECALNANQICTGCYRSGREIGRWSSASELEKRRIVKQSTQRRMSSKPECNET
ncbi:DUF1289 domain-containing protein [Novipirellula aureliae]|uniref:DUF1289 domain-containing protein n=1 Tax=Novipirellula aureliae TaxID=2527966 RepID=UPI0028F443E2|nr:DUF1289 domain-containing protein [Novipirellula aureliae]